ncbi:MAG: ATP-binding protein [Prevotellaceae bacterium]|jgi:AAA+ ATPase superfamily predicted ATPase|nr:ATP-binding protein [Prevotellaceae bacterium]
MGNPFNFGTATFGDQFTDREQDTKRLSTNFKHGINTILISPRRWGKTSLVQKVAASAGNRRLKIVTLDVFACRTVDEFYALLATEVIKQTSNKWQEWVENAKKFLVALVPKISIGTDPVKDFTISLDFSDKKISAEEVLTLPQRIAEEKGFHIVICIDEFQQITEFEDHLSFQKKLRSVWQLQTAVSYCLYGSKKHILSKLFSKQSMPFYKFGDVFFLQKITTDHWISFICERFQSTGKRISKKIATQICETVDNHSSYVQQLAWIIWSKTTKTVTTDIFESSVTELLNQNSMLYFRYIEELSGFQLNFLQAIADGVSSEFTKSSILQQYQLGTASNIKRLKDALENRELIDIDNKNVTFNDPVFRLWFKNNIRRF